MLFDDVLRLIGEFGPYQIGLYCLLGFVGFPTGLQSVGIVFLGLEVDHWCDVPELHHLTPSQQKYIAIPLEENGEYSKCSVYNLNFSQYSNDDLRHWNRSQMALNSTSSSISQCKSWAFDTSQYNSLVNKWSLVCDRSYLVQLLQTTYMAGWLVGCLIYGQISDRYGRKLTMLIALAVSFIVCLAQTFVPIYSIYAVGRFLIGTSTGGYFTAIFVLCMEVIGPKWRMETGVWIQGWFSLGVLLLSGVAWLLSDLFALHLFLSLFLLLFIPYYWLVPESPRWLISQGRHKEAEVIIRKIAKFNKRQLPAKLILTEENEVAHKGFITDLFKSKRIFMITFSMWCAWFMASMDYYGLSIGVSILPGNTFLNMFMSGLIELPSFVMACFLLNKVGRRWPNAGTLIASGVCCLLMAAFITNKDLSVLVVILSLSGKFFCAAAFSIVYVYAAELFPTVVRNVGVGSSSMCARIAGLLQPQIQILGNSWAPLPFLVYGALSVVAGIISCFLPETLNRQLPETLEDVENFHRKPTANIRLEEELNITETKAMMEKTDNHMNPPI